LRKQTFLDVPLPAVSSWSAWYAKYLSKPVFRGAVGSTTGKKASGDTETLFPSREYREWFINGNTEYLGKTMRFAKPKNKECLNSSFARFLEEHTSGEVICKSDEYRQVQPNLVASFKSVAKYDKSQPVLDAEAWRIAGEWTERHFALAMGGSRVVSQELVVQELDLQTSCGFPWSLEYHTKSEFLVSPAFGALGDYWDMLGRGEGPQEMVPIWTCAQKCELRTVEKLAQNKIRTFTASPLEHSVACNRLCLDMNNNFYASANRCWSFVGANKYNQGFDRLYRRLNKHPNAFELDESEYDSSLFAEAMFGQMEIRWNMLQQKDKTSENRLRLERVYDSIVNSVIVLENGELIQKHTGNPSGSANTIVDNTMILFRLFAYAWIVLVAEKFGEENSKRYSVANSGDVKQRQYIGNLFGGYLDFMQHVEAALNGDDNTFTVSDICVGWFNPRSVAAVWSGIGVTTNTPCFDPRPLSECTFLSQSFVKIDGLWLPCPATDRVLSSMKYGASFDDVRWHLMRASALRIDSWANVEVREILMDYINYLRRQYADEMFGEVQFSVDRDPMSMDQVVSVYKSDEWIWGLYSGEESLRQVVDEKTDLLKTVDSFSFPKFLFSD